MSKIINSIRKCFTQIPNAIVIDSSLSDGAYRVFSYMSTRPDDWQFNNRDIQHKLNIKRAETIAKYWKELINSGWVSRQPVLNENGKPTGYFNYILNFEPQIPTPQNSEVVKNDLPNRGTTDKPYTVNQQLRKNRSYTNKEICTNKEITNTPFPQTDNLTNDSGIVGVWLEHLQNLNCSFTDFEVLAISEFAKYKSEAGESLTNQQINLTLERLTEHKNAGYDICRMVKHSIASGYKAVMTPTKEFLVAGFSSKPLSTKPSRYPATEYITPDNQAQKTELRNYLERCYMREMVDPRTKLPLSNEQKRIFKAHLVYAKSKHIGITEYIFQNEVLSGVCLLDQVLDDASSSSKRSVA